MPKEIEMPDGTIAEFPDDFTDEQIEKALKEDQQANAPGALATGIGSAAVGVAPTAAAAAAFIPAFEAGATVGGPYAPLTGLVAGVGGSILAGAGAEWVQNKALQKFAPDWLRKLYAGQEAHPAAAATGRIASAAAGFEFAPGNALATAEAIPTLLRGGTLSPRALRAAKGTAAQVGAQLGITGLETAITQGRVPTPSELGESAGIALLYGHPRYSFPVPKSLTRKVTDASRQQKAAEVHGAVRPQPEQGAGQVPAQEGGPRVQPQAQAVAEEPQIPLGVPETDPNVPNISGSDETGYTLRFQGSVETDFETKEEAQLAAQQVLAGTRQMKAPANAKTEDKTQPANAATVEEGKPLSRAELMARDAKRAKSAQQKHGEEYDSMVERLTNEALGYSKEQGTESEADDRFSTESGDVPFSSGGYMRAINGRVEIKKPAFRNWILGELVDKGFSYEQMRQIVRAAVDEEVKHIRVMENVSDEDVANYYRGLSIPEKAIENYIYTGQFTRTGAYADMTDLLSGHEAIRRRMQAAERLTPREFLETVGLERWTLKSLDSLGTMIRGVRELMGTDASKQQLRVFEQAIRNIDYAKASLQQRQQQQPPPEARPRGAERQADRERYEAIYRDIKEYNKNRQWPPGPLMQELENLKNKYGGMPPPTEDAPEARRRRTDYRRDMPEMDRDLEEAIILGDPNAEDTGQARAMGYTPNLFTSLTSLVWKRPQDWNLSPKNRERLMRWWSAAEGTGFGRSELMASGIEATESYVAHLLQEAEHIRKTLKAFGREAVQHFGMGNADRANQLEQEAQNLLDGLGKSRKMLQEMTGETTPKFELYEDPAFEVKWYRDQINRISREMPPHGDPRREAWQETLDEYKAKLEEFTKKAEKPDLSQPIVDRPPPPPEHPELPLARPRGQRDFEKMPASLGIPLWDVLRKDWFEGAGVRPRPEDTALMIDMLATTPESKWSKLPEGLKDQLHQWFRNQEGGMYDREKLIENRLLEVQKNRAQVLTEFGRKHFAEAEEQLRDLLVAVRQSKLAAPEDYSPAARQRGEAEEPVRFRATSGFRKGHEIIVTRDSATGMWRATLFSPSEGETDYGVHGQMVPETHELFDTKERAVRGAENMMWQFGVEDYERVPWDEAPFARKRGQKKEPEAQGQMFGKTPLGAPKLIKPTPLEQRGAPELSRGITAAQIADAAQNIFEGKAPQSEAGVTQPREYKQDFRTFFNWAKRASGGRVQSGPMFSQWMDTVVKNVMPATGAKLNELVDKLGLQWAVYPWRWVPHTTRDIAGKETVVRRKEYTKVQIPDEGEYIPEPVKGPTTPQAEIMSELAQYAAERERLMRGEKLPLEAPRSLEKVKPGAAAKAEEQRRQAIVAGQKRRMKAISAIFKKMVEDSMPATSDVDINRTDIFVDDLDWSNPNAKAGTWHKVTAEERLNPDKLRETLAIEARRNSFDPVSLTKKVMVLRNKNTGEHALVSAYPHGRSDINVMEPSGGTGVKGKPNVAYSTVKGTWIPEWIGTLREPIQNFRKVFGNFSDFHGYLGRAAEEAEENTARAYLDVPRGDITEEEVMAEEAEPRELDVQHMQWAPVEGATPEGEEITFRHGTGVTAAEGGTFMGPAAEVLREGKGEIRKRAPLSQQEVMALHEFLTKDFVPHSQERMAEVIGRLSELASANKLSPKEWNAISALRKAADEIHARYPEVDREGAYKLALQKLYGLLQEHKDPADFLAQSMGQFSRPTREVRRTAPAKVPSAAAEGETGPVFQEPELVEPGAIGPEPKRFPKSDIASRFIGPTLPLQPFQTELPPAELLKSPEQRYVEAMAQQEYPYLPTKTLRGLPETPSEIGGRKFKGLIPRKPRAMPHELAMGVKPYGSPEARLRGISPEMDRMMQDMGEYALKFSAPFTRAKTNAEINAWRDGTDRIVERYGISNANEIRVASVKVPEGAPKVSLLHRAMGGVMFSKQAKQVREAVKAVVAAKDMTETIEWQRVAGEWAEQRRRENDLRAAHRKVPERDPEQMPKFVQPTEINPLAFDRLVALAEKGMNRAREKMQSGFPWDRWVGRKWMKAAQKLKDEALWAKDHYKDEEVVRTTGVYERVMADHLKMMNQNGVTIAGRDYYVPGLYDGEIWADHALTWGDMRILGRQYRLPKTFKNYWDAISNGPYLPVNADVADLAHHSLVAGSRVVQLDLWLNSLKSLVDKVSEKPVAIEPVWMKINPPGPELEAMRQSIERTVNEHLENHPLKGTPAHQLLQEEMLGVALQTLPSRYGWQVPPGHPEYSLVYPSPRGKPMAIREGYKNVVESALAQSAIRKMPGARQALMASQAVKHGLILIVDTFHPGRLFQYGLAMSGKNPWSGSVGYKGGLSALSWKPETLDQAVRIGALPKEAADWAREKIKVNDRTRVITTDRSQLVSLALTLGLNASQSADTLYRNAVQRIPFIGQRWNKMLDPINKWTFDRITPGLITESFVRNFERLNADPGSAHLSLNDKMRVVIKDMNVFYGNLGRQGIFKNPTFRDIAQILVLAPLWQEGIIGKELRTMSRLTGASWFMGRRGLGANAYLGPLTRGMTRGLAAYFVLTQAINLVSRGKFTWQNEEEDHKMDAWWPTPWDSKRQGVWVSPLSVFGEAMHDMIRLMQTKPTTWSAISQFGANKMGPLGRMLGIATTGRTPTGEVLTSTGAVVSEAAKELAPLPISVGTPIKALSHELTGWPAARKPGETFQRSLGMIGVKSQTPTTPEQDVRRLAERFVKKEGLKWEPMVFAPTDEASYSKLRAALRNEDLSSARRYLKELRQHRTDQQIVRSMREATARPFTGTKANEKLFLYSLNDHELESYFRANLAREEQLQRFLEFFVTQ